MSEAVDLTPAGGRAPVRRVLAGQVRLELRLWFRRADAVGLALVVPLLALIGVGLTDVVELAQQDRLGFVIPGVIALTLMSTAFTSQVVVVAQERAGHVLKRMVGSALPGWGMLTAKAVAVTVLAVGQAGVLAAVGVVAGWRPDLGGLPGAAGLVLLAVAGFTGLALLLAGTLRAEAAGAAATLGYVLLLVGGGLVFPQPAPGSGLQLLPTTALAVGLRAVLSEGTGAPVWCWFDLGLWATVGIAAARRWFRWQV